MPKISKRGVRLPASPIRKLVPFADEAKKRGVKVYHLNIGQPDLPTPQKALDALKNIDEENIKIEFNGGQGPCIITPVEGDDFVYLILPIRR